MTIDMQYICIDLSQLDMQAKGSCQGYTIDIYGLYYKTTPMPKKDFL